MKPLRHLHFTQSLEPLYGGGLGSSVVALHRQLLAQGIDSTLCATHGATPQQLVDKSHEFRRTGPHPLYYSLEMQREARTLVENADIIHGHGLYTATNWIFGHQAARQSKPLVYHVHGFFEPWILSRSRWKKNLVHALFENRNFKRAVLWRGLTEKEADQIRGCGIKAPIVVVPNGIDPGEYIHPPVPTVSIATPLIPALEKRKLRILFLARLHPKKGLDILVNAWARLGRLSNDWELVIAGPDEQGYMAQVQSRANSLGVSKNLVFTGAVTGMTKVALLHTADLFVLPSYSEGFSITLLEAMASQVPVIATRACNCPDISEAFTGWECEPTVESLLQTLQIAMGASASERTQRGANGRLLVQTKYTWPRVVSVLNDACASLR